MTRAKAQLVKWGKSLAVRIPKNVLERADPQEGEDLEVGVENGHIWLQPLSQAPSLPRVDFRE